MDKNTAYILNDLLDVVEELAKTVRELNPGANWSFIDFMLSRTGRQIEEAMRSLEKVP